MERPTFTFWGFAILLAFSIGIIIVTEQLGKRVTLGHGMVTQKEPYTGIRKFFFKYKFGLLPEPSRFTVQTDNNDTIIVVGSGTGVELNDSIYFYREENIRGFVYNVLAQ